MKPEYKPHTPRLKLVDEYIRALFKDELPDGIKFHDANHTLHPARGVVAVANRIAISENIPEPDRELLIAAAYFHDTGYIREFKKNEPIAARMAGRILKLIGYKPDEVETVQKMILATDLGCEPQTHLEKILCDADLDNLGREDFFKLDVSDDAKWYKETLEIVKKHQYYTESQIKLREKGKQKNINVLLNKLENIEKKKQDPI
jgi:predicted metal-dependent HD superfamily phosphohydrolase